MNATKSVRLCVVGGFLGAGKTTALLRLARAYSKEGLRVGLITNDQAEGLVDTGSLRVRGFRVEEIAGACFCCKFDDLAQAAERIRVEDRPDVLLGEPVGSCTDLAATVVAPFRKLYGELDLPGAATWYARCLSLPLYPGMADADVAKVADALKDVLGL